MRRFRTTRYSGWIVRKECSGSVKTFLKDGYECSIPNWRRSDAGRLRTAGRNLTDEVTKMMSNLPLGVSIAWSTTTSSCLIGPRRSQGVDKLRHVPTSAGVGASHSVAKNHNAEQSLPPPLVSAISLVLLGISCRNYIGSLYFDRWIHFWPYFC